jgi:hypothetical protein
MFEPSTPTTVVIPAGSPAGLSIEAVSTEEWAWVCEEHPDSEWPHGDCDAGWLRRRSASGEWIESAGHWEVEMVRDDHQYPTVFHVAFEDATTEEAARAFAKAEMPSFTIEGATAFPR